MLALGFGRVHQIHGCKSQDKISLGTLNGAASARALVAFSSWAGRGRAWQIGGRRSAARYCLGRRPHIFSGSSANSELGSWGGAALNEAATAASPFAMWSA